MTNLLKDLPANLPEELFETLLTAGNVRIERIISTGHCSPPDFWYEQEEAEWVLVLQGETVLQIEGTGPVSMRAGDHQFLPPHCRHRIDWTTPEMPTVWLAIFIADGEPEPTVVPTAAIQFE